MNLSVDLQNNLLQNNNFLDDLWFFIITQSIEGAVELVDRVSDRNNLLVIFLDVNLGLFHDGDLWLSQNDWLDWFDNLVDGDETGVNSSSDSLQSSSSRSDLSSELTDSGSLSLSNSLRELLEKLSQNGSQSKDGLVPLCALLLQSGDNSSLEWKEWFWFLDFLDDSDNVSWVVVNWLVSVMNNRSSNLNDSSSNMVDFLCQFDNNLSEFDDLLFKDWFLFFGNSINLVLKHNDFVMDVSDLLGQFNDLLFVDLNHVFLRSCWDKWMENNMRMRMVNQSNWQWLSWVENLVESSSNGQNLVFQFSDGNLGDVNFFDHNWFLVLWKGWERSLQDLDFFNKDVDVLFVNGNLLFVDLNNFDDFLRMMDVRESVRMLRDKDWSWSRNNVNWSLQVVNGLSNVNDVFQNLFHGDLQNDDLFLDCWDLSSWGNWQFVDQSLQSVLNRNNLLLQVRNFLVEFVNDHLSSVRQFVLLRDLWLFWVRDGVNDVDAALESESGGQKSLSDSVAFSVTDSLGGGLSVRISTSWE